MSELATLAILFAWSALAATVLPLGSEVPLTAAILTLEVVAIPVIVATAGNYLGACTTFYLGRAAGRRISARAEARPLSPRQERAARLVQRFGAPALALSWVPLLGDLLVGVAGATGVRFLPFTAWVVAGKLARYTIVAMLVHQTLS